MFFSKNSFVQVSGKKSKLGNFDFFDGFRDEKGDPLKKTRKRVTDLWYKYTDFFIWSIKDEELFMYQLNLGHGFFDWNWTNFGFISKVNDKLSLFNLRVLIINLRRTLSFIINLFASKPFTRTIVTYGFPKAMLNYALFHQLKPFITNISSIYFSKWLPGTLTSRRFIYRRYLN
jgi:hypothetical protein